MELDLFAGARVRDYESSRSWYERLLGKEPTFFPNATEAVWELADHMMEVKDGRIRIVTDAAEQRVSGVRIRLGSGSITARELCGRPECGEPRRESVATPG